MSLCSLGDDGLRTLVASNIQGFLTILFLHITLIYSFFKADFAQGNICCCLLLWKRAEAEVFDLRHLYVILNFP